MLAWFFCFVLLTLGVHLALGGVTPWIARVAPGGGPERARLQKVVMLLQEIEETLSAGLVPTDDRWDRLRALPAPWGSLAYDSLRELRSSGGALLPTLGRLKKLALEHDASLSSARAKSSQALAQALVCAALVPLFGAALWALLPGLSERPASWAGACAIALSIAAGGALWMLVMADNARWAGLPAHARHWVLASQCAGERFLALVRAGNPADLAWTRAAQLLDRESPGLARLWGASVWGEGKPAMQTGATRLFEDAGSSLRKAVQVSLMEGRPCTERVEAALLALRQELASQVERELQLLGTRALKPLFMCVAPSIFLMLGLGLWLSWEHLAVGGL